MNREDSRFLKLGLAIFGALAAAVVVYFFFARIGSIQKFLMTVLSALQPVLTGMAMAYVLFPLERMLEGMLRHVRKLGRFTRPVSVFLTLVVVIALVVLFCSIVLPRLVGTVSELVATLPGLLNTQLEKLRAYVDQDSEASKTIVQMLESIGNSLMDWIKTDIFGMVSSISGKVLSIGSAVVNLVIAVVVNVYLLLDRERYIAQWRKLFYAISRNARFNAIVEEAVRQTDRIFSGFITGKLMDSFVLGLMVFVSLTILRIPYALLVSVLIGVTNIIPMFGGMIGTVPSAFLILLVSPLKCLVFLVTITILQQIDDNIIGPRILGNSTGLSALYVTVGMLLFGKLLGFLGMIVGVPLFATLYYFVKCWAEYSLGRREMPVETQAYVLEAKPAPKRNLHWGKGADK